MHINVEALLGKKPAKLFIHTNDNQQLSNKIVDHIDNVACALTGARLTVRWQEYRFHNQTVGSKRIYSIMT